MLPYEDIILIKSLRIDKGFGARNEKMFRGLIFFPDTVYVSWNLINDRAYSNCKNTALK